MLSDEGNHKTLSLKNKKVESAYYSIEDMGK